MQTKPVAKFVAKLMAKSAPGFGVPTKPVAKFAAKFVTEVGMVQ